MHTVLQAMDTDNSGTITADELKAAMQKQGSPLVQEELTRLLTSIDVDSTGRYTDSTPENEHLNRVKILSFQTKAL